jgi:Uma2 family endonuclease
MATAALTRRMSVEEYRRTPFQPDVEYVDGLIEERHLGGFDHARLQAALLRVLGDREEDWNVYVSPKLRVQVSATTFRVPDVCLTDAREEIEQVPRRPPLLCVEVLSPEDRLPRVVERVQDFHRMGVALVWIFDPESRQVWVSSANEVREWSGGTLTVPGTLIELDPADVFARMARRR